MLAEAIRHNLTHMVARLLVAVQINRSEHRERAQVVDTSYVVVVDMCHQYGVERLERQRHQLLAYIGSAVDEHACACRRLYKRHTAQTMVARIFTATHFALATKRRNATRSACTEQGYSYIIVVAHYSELIFLLFRIFLPILPTLRFCEETKEFYITFTSGCISIPNLARTSSMMRL